MRNNDITARIEARLNQNNRSIKTYASHQFARSKAEKLSEQASQYFLGSSELQGPDFVITFLPNVKRWTVVFHLSSWLQRHSTGGYVGIFSDEGFFTC
jgi:hypothetical protein